MNIGERIRVIAQEIERLDPSKAPFFMGIERPTAGFSRCLFQGKTLYSEEEGLGYAQQMLAEVQAAAIKGSEMRGAGNHVPPSLVLPQPADNTSGYIRAQVDRWFRTSSLPRTIHWETAREIAAWYAAGTNGFAQFASTGTITDGFAREIQLELDQLVGLDHTESARALRALARYLSRVSEDSR